MIKPRTISWVLILLFVLGWATFYLIQRYPDKLDSKNEYSDILRKGELRVCGEYDPFSFYEDSTGQHGFHRELIQAFASQHGLKVVYRYDGNVDRRVKGLENGTYDILMGPLPVITPLKQRLAFTMPLYTSRLVLIQRSTGSPIRNQVELAGKRLVIPAFSPIIYRINHLATEISDSIFVRSVRITTNEELVRLVLSGKEDFAAMDEHVAKALKATYPGMDCSTPLSLPQFQAWAVRPGSTVLLDSLNAFIERYKKSPAFERLLQQ